MPQKANVVLDSLQLGGEFLFPALVRGGRRRKVGSYRPQLSPLPRLSFLHGLKLPFPPPPLVTALSFIRVTHQEATISPYDTKKIWFFKL